METDIGNPIDYKAEVESLNKDMSDDGDNYEYYHQPSMPPPPPPPPMMHQQWQPVMNNDGGRDIFASIDKTAYIVIFVAFILGFFMGKTMQPVILRPS